MKKLFMNAVGAVAISGALLAAVPAEARSGGRHGGYSGHHGGGGGHWNGGSNWNRGSHGYRGSRGHHGYRSYAYRGHGGSRYYGYGYGYPAYWGPRYYGYGYGYGGDDAALAIGAGLLGVAVGTAIASDHDDGYRYDDRRYYDRRDDGYYDDYEYGY